MKKGNLLSKIHSCLKVRETLLMYYDAWPKTQKKNHFWYMPYLSSHRMTVQYPLPSAQQNISGTYCISPKWARLWALKAFFQSFLAQQFESRFPSVGSYVYMSIYRVWVLLIPFQTSNLRLQQAHPSNMAALYHTLIHYWLQTRICVRNAKCVFT